MNNHERKILEYAQDFSKLDYITITSLPEPIRSTIILIRSELKEIEKSNINCDNWVDLVPKK